ncbi:unnamed protein product [Acanthosepion pharaonis]|uniref:Uncharacterized protein n=1 Tax=Acanthosepion pharaonis TaxID=158019 RepID=A0A812DY36_ACAPH|nr:unnamed protein product [Sepia pharaonis]
MSIYLFVSFSVSISLSIVLHLSLFFNLCLSLFQFASFFSPSLIIFLSFSSSSIHSLIFLSSNFIDFTYFLSFFSPSSMHSLIFSFFLVTSIDLFFLSSCLSFIDLLFLFLCHILLYFFKSFFEALQTILEIIKTLFLSNSANSLSLLLSPPTLIGHYNCLSLISNPSLLQTQTLFAYSLSPILLFPPLPLTILHSLSL